jgi:hypothetical protein
MSSSPQPAPRGRTEIGVPVGAGTRGTTERFGELPTQLKTSDSNFVHQGPAVQRAARHFGFSTVREIALRQVETGAAVADVFTKFEVNAWTSYYWKQQYAGLGLGRIPRLT